MAQLAGVAWGLGWLLTLSAIYEPVRIALLRTQGEAVGGVGGVGGLTNQWNPVPQCEGFPAYCWHNGVFLGLTPFALVVLLAWTVPLSLAVLLAPARPPPDIHCSSGWVGGFIYCWTTLSCLWFAGPSY